MSSREKILNAIKKAKPAEAVMPDKFVAPASGDNLTEKYLEVLQSIGGQGGVVHDLGEAQALLAGRLQSGAEAVNCVAEMAPYNADAYAEKPALETEAVETVFLKGAFAVAENASVWVPESLMVNRILPFICQELVVIIEEKSILPTMHEAYERIRVNEDGFGTFIAGPSKTADIEQSLVIGAHGPLALRVFVVRPQA